MVVLISSPQRSSPPFSLTAAARWRYGRNRQFRRNCRWWCRDTSETHCCLTATSSTSGCSCLSRLSTSEAKKCVLPSHVSYGLPAMHRHGCKAGGLRIGSHTRSPIYTACLRPPPCLLSSKERVAKFLPLSRGRMPCRRFDDQYRRVVATRDDARDGSRAWTLSCFALAGWRHSSTRRGSRG